MYEDSFNFSFILEAGSFKTCVVCEAYLLRRGNQYFIEKSYKGEEVIFEYAICLNCAANFRTIYSEDSKRIIENFFVEKVNLIARGEKLLKSNNHRIGNWLSHCLFTDVKKEGLKEYHIYAHCDGENLLLSYLPFLICSQVIGELYQKLSRKTKDENDRFISDYLNKMPDFDRILNGPQVVLV